MDNKKMSLVGKLNRVAGKLEGLAFCEKDPDLTEAMFDLVEAIDGIVLEVQEE